MPSVCMNVQHQTVTGLSGQKEIHQEHLPPSLSCLHQTWIDLLAEDKHDLSRYIYAEPVYICSNLPHLMDSDMSA